MWLPFKRCFFSLKIFKYLSFSWNNASSQMRILGEMSLFQGTNDGHFPTFNVLLNIFSVQICSLCHRIKVYIPILCYSISTLVFIYWYRNNYDKKTNVNFSKQGNTCDISWEKFLFSGFPFEMTSLSCAHLSNQVIQKEIHPYSNILYKVLVTSNNNLTSSRSDDCTYQPGVSWVIVT